MKKDWKKILDPRFFPLIAHRGLHGGDIPENSLAAFKLAIAKDIPYELDVHLSKDGTLFVHHDDDLFRVTGKHGAIEEITDKEIKEGYRLSNGESIPTLEEVIELAPNHPAVIELKAVGNSKELGRATRRFLDEKGIKPSNVIIISFYPKALRSFGKGYFRELLVFEERKAALMFRHMFEGLDIDKLLVHEKSVQKWHENHKILNVWTLENEAELRSVAGLADQYTFELIDLETAKEIVSK